jgi:hypothetical protein
MRTDDDRAWSPSLALVAALALHVGLAAIVHYSLGGAAFVPQAYPQSPLAFSEFDLDLEHPEAERALPVALRLPEGPSRRGPIEGPAEARRVSRTLETAAQPRADSGPPVEREDAAGPSSPRRASGTASINEPPNGERPIDLGIAAGDWARWTKPVIEGRATPAAGAERGTAPASSTGGLAEELDAKDRELGLGPAGAMLSAAHEAAGASTAPASGTAAFSITHYRNGETEVDLLRASTHFSGWRNVAEALAAAIKRKPPRLKEGTAGLRTVVEINAEERLPNGSSARTEDAKIAVSGPPVRATTETFRDTRERNPFVDPPPGVPVDKLQFTLNWDQLGVWVKGRGKVCNYQGGVTAQGHPKATGSCDFANIGAHPVRVVHAKVISQTML